MSQFPKTQSYHYEGNWFTSLFYLVSKDLIDAFSKQPAVHAKMKFNGHVDIYTDRTKSAHLLSCQRTDMIGREWDVYDVQNQNKHLAHLKSAVFKSMMKAGMEQWEITDPAGHPFLIFGAGGDESMGKHLMDNMMNIYNPTHQYNVWNAQNKPVARIWMKHGVFKHVYDLVFEEGVSDEERKVTVALFATLVLMLKK